MDARSDGRFLDKMAGHYSEHDTDARPYFVSGNEFPQPNERGTFLPPFSSLEYGGFDQQSPKELSNFVGFEIQRNI